MYSLLSTSVKDSDLQVALLGSRAASITVAFKQLGDEKLTSATQLLLEIRTYDSEDRLDAALLPKRV